MNSSYVSEKRYACNAVVTIKARLCAIVVSLIGLCVGMEAYAQTDYEMLYIYKDQGLTNGESFKLGIAAASIALPILDAAEIPIWAETELGGNLSYTPTTVGDAYLAGWITDDEVTTLIQDAAKLGWFDTVESIVLAGTSAEVGMEVLWDSIDAHPDILTDAQVQQETYDSVMVATGDPVVAAEASMGLLSPYELDKILHGGVAQY